jgi:protein-disulfide isomerase
MPRNDEPEMTPSDKSDESATPSASPAHAEPAPMPDQPLPASPIDLEAPVEPSGASPVAAPAAKAQPKPPPKATKPAEPTLTASQLALLLGIVALTVIAIVLYSQERTIDELALQVRNLGIEQQKLGAQMTSKGGFTPADIDVAGAPALGPASDVVTLVEFSDYECPFCIKHFTTTMPQLQASYIATGKIRYVFKDFPIDENHPMAIRAHEAAHCAMEQNKFWPLHVKLFSPPGTHTPDQLVARATEAGLDIPAFKACIASGRTTAAIRASAEVADKLGADGTPSFYLGTRDLATDRVHVVKMLDGAQPFSVFQQAIDELLKQH